MKQTIKYLIIPSLLVSAASLLSAVTLTAEQLEKKEKYFMKFDADGDKALSEAEFIIMTKTQFEKKEKTGWEAEGKKRFARNDANGDGKVTFKEWIAMQK